MLDPIFVFRINKNARPLFRSVNCALDLVSSGLDGPQRSNKGLQEQIHVVIWTAFYFSGLRSRNVNYIDAR